ncbi:uncharacterized protein At2g33490-like isoform X2 [Salvia splendens]|uniref:uncharacterized protein At2g33490-like isoform X2 n=1 Tax=Salvia splendens TaxID=180675 RepID=UPI001C27D802|nr:uncharacterized protein At2g33490-like isoform X2 [Salvia splendens]
MKSSLLRMRIIGHKNRDPNGKWDQNFSLPMNGLTQAAEDMKDMRSCYDSLLLAAAATSNSAYEFSESLLEMANSLLEKTTMHDGGESRGALSMLGKVQLELQKLVDSYRSQIIMTITNPSECLLSELRKVEEMKLQCDEKREIFEYMVEQIKEKGKSRHGKGETFSLQQLKVVHDEYDDAAKLCAFRVESLKQGQSRSLFTQAARHHAAQLNFFRKGLQSLEAVEPYIKNVAEKQHIDFELSELNDGEKDDGDNGSESNDYGELSFDYRPNEQELGSAYTLRNSMELNKLDAPSAQTSQVKDVELLRGGSRNQWDQLPSLSQRPRAGSHSAPLYPEKFDATEKLREIRHALPELTTTYALPTPADAKVPTTSTSIPLSSPKLPAATSKNLWHSSPLDMGRPKKITDDQFSARKPQTVAEESSIYKHSLPLPPLTEGAAIPQVDSQIGFDAKNHTRQAFSGPITSKPSFNMPISSNDMPQSFSGLLSRPSGSQSPLLVNVTHNASPSLETSPKITELHELPRPPDTFGSKPIQSIGTLGHSAPLVNRKQEVSPTNRNPFRRPREGSPLPLPQLTVSQSFSIPSSSQRVASPPLTPISLLHLKSPNSGQIRGGN